MKKVLKSLMIGILLFSSFGCFGKKEPVEEENNIDTTPEKKLNIIDTSSKSRPIAVMINNLNLARPYQSGLQDAYLVYEIIVEGGITRMMAVFKDKYPEKVGSVRSSRHYYLDYALENDAIYVHFGWSPQAQSDIKSMGINNVNGLTYGAPYLFRDTSLNISSEHRAFTNLNKVKELADSKFRKETNRDTLLNYSVENINISNLDSAKTANKIVIPYSASYVTSYNYDEGTGTYLRSVNGTAHKDYVTKKQYTTKNIIVYQVNNGKISDDSKNRQELDNVGKGTGYYITNGHAVPINWEKTSRTSQTVYKYQDGKEIDVNDGNTFIQMQPKGQTLTIE